MIIRGDIQEMVRCLKLPHPGGNFLPRAENTKSNNLLFVWFFVIAHYAVVAAGAQTDEYSQPSKFYKHWCLETYCSDNVESTKD